MTDKILKATHTGELKIGDAVLECAVLEDGTRVFSQHGVNTALGRGKASSKKRRKTIDDETGVLPSFFAANNVIPFIPKDLIDPVSNPIAFISTNGQHALGFRAELLPEICKVWMDVKDHGELHPTQQKTAQQASILIRGLATVGVTALVDEATGYQEVRERDALQRILDKFLKDEAHKWYKTFPDEFWHKLIKIKGYPSYMALKRPAFVGHWVNDIIYDRLAPGIREKLNELNPRRETGRRRNTHTQHLTEEHGVPELKLHIEKAMTLMDAAANDTEFKRLLNRSLPKWNETLEMQLDDKS